MSKKKYIKTGIIGSEVQLSAPLTTPAPLRAFARTDTEVIIQFSRIGEAVSYPIERDTDPAFSSPTLVDTILQADDEGFLIDTGLTPNTEYHYRTKAVGASSESAYITASCTTLITPFMWLEPSGIQYGDSNDFGITSADSYTVTQINDWFGSSGLNLTPNAASTGLNTNSLIGNPVSKWIANQQYNFSSLLTLSGDFHILISAQRNDNISTTGRIVDDAGGGNGELRILSFNRPISSVTDNGGLAQFNTSVAHGYANGDTVEIKSTTSYNGVYKGLVSVVDSNSFTVGVSFVADETGTATRGFDRVQMLYIASSPNTTINLSQENHLSTTDFYELEIKRVSGQMYARLRGNSWDTDAVGVNTNDVSFGNWFGAVFNELERFVIYNQELTTDQANAVFDHLKTEAYTLPSQPNAFKGLDTDIAITSNLIPITNFDNKGTSSYVRDRAWQKGNKILVNLNLDDSQNWEDFLMLIDIDTMQHSALKSLGVPVPISAPKEDYDYHDSGSTFLRGDKVVAIEAASHYGAGLSASHEIKIQESGVNMDLSVFTPKKLAKGIARIVGENSQYFQSLTVGNTTIVVCQNFKFDTVLYKFVDNMEFPVETIVIFKGNDNNNWMYKHLVYSEDGQVRLFLNHYDNDPNPGQPDYVAYVQSPITDLHTWTDRTGSNSKEIYDSQSPFTTDELRAGYMIFDVTPYTGSIRVEDAWFDGTTVHGVAKGEDFDATTPGENTFNTYFTIDDVTGAFAKEEIDTGGTNVETEILTASSINLWLDVNGHPHVSCFETNGGYWIWAEYERTAANTWTRIGALSNDPTRKFKRPIRTRNANVISSSKTALFCIKEDLSDTDANGGLGNFNGNGDLYVAVVDLGQAIAPTSISLSSTSIDENNSINDVVGILSANGSPSSTFTLVSGTGDTDNGSFNISGSNLRAGEVFDYETKTSYSIRVRATNSEGNTEDTFTITINDVTESNISNVSVSENSGVFTLSYDYTNEPNKPPVINNVELSSYAPTEGDTLTLTIDAETRSIGSLSTGDYTYQWYRSDNKDGLNRAAISGATSSSYTLVSADVNKLIDCEVTVAVDEGQNLYSDPYITRSTEAVAVGSLTLQRTVKVNFGNNAIGAVTGYNAANASTKSGGAVLSNLNEDDGTATTWDLESVATWGAFASGDTSNASTGDLQAGIIGLYHNSGGNNAKTVGKKISSLDPSKFYTIKIVSVADSSETTNYDTYWQCTYKDGDTSEVTIDPVAQAASPSVVTIATEIAPTAGGEITLYGREPGSDSIYLSSMIIEEYA